MSSDSETRSRDDGCLLCGKLAEQAAIGVYSEFAGDGDRQGERIWICEACAQVEEYARAFVIQARDHFTIYGDNRLNGLPEMAYSYRIVSPVLRAQVDEQGLNRFHAWTADL